MGLSWACHGALGHDRLRKLARAHVHMSVLIRLARGGAGQESTKTCCPCLRLDQGVVVIGLSRADVPGGRGLVGRVRSAGNLVQIVVVDRLLLDVALLVFVVDLWLLVVVFHGRFSLARAPGPIHWVVSPGRFLEGATGASLSWGRRVSRAARFRVTLHGVAKAGRPSCPRDA